MTSIPAVNIYALTSMLRIPAVLSEFVIKLLNITVGSPSLPFTRSTSCTNILVQIEITSICH